MLEAPPRFVVVDRCPLRQRGIVSVLVEAGCDVDPCDDLRAWVQEDGRRGVVVSVEHDGRGLRHIGALRAQRSDLAIVALLAERNACQPALQAGANSALEQHASLDLVVEAVLHALEGRTVLPTPMARDLVVGPAEPPTVELSPDERQWLRALAAGSTVAEIAEDAAYSNREMHRLLRGIYDRLGAENRSQALISVARQGIVD